MVMTVLEGRVAKEKWSELSASYEGGLTRMPPQMVQSFLVQSRDEPTVWRGVSIWRSREALDEYRRSVATPGGVLLFRSVGSEPSLTVYEVVAHRAAP